jgi:hypothetical protein
MAQCGGEIKSPASVIFAVPSSNWKQRTGRKETKGRIGFGGNQ